MVRARVFIRGKKESQDIDFCEFVGLDKSYEVMTVQHRFDKLGDGTFLYSAPPLTITLKER